MVEPSSEEDSYESILARIQAHRAEIFRAQQAVLKREIDMATYNKVYKERLDAIHALEAKLHDLQGGP